MTTFARIADGVVAELIQVQPDEDIADFFPPTLVETLVKLVGGQNGTVQPGWHYNGTKFTPPAPIEPPPVSRIITPRAFRLRFTAEEKAALTLAASKGLEAGDASLQVFLDDLSASQEVDLDHPELRAGMDAVVAAKLMTKARAAEILAA